MKRSIPFLIPVLLFMALSCGRRIHVDPLPPSGTATPTPSPIPTATQAFAACTPVLMMTPAPWVGLGEIVTANYVGVQTVQVQIYDSANVLVTTKLFASVPVGMSIFIDPLDDLGNPLNGTYTLVVTAGSRCWREVVVIQATTPTATRTSTPSPSTTPSPTSAVATATATATSTAACWFAPTPGNVCPDPYATPYAPTTVCSSAPVTFGNTRVEVCDASNGMVAKLIWVQNLSLPADWPTRVDLDVYVINSLYDVVYVRYNGTLIATWDGADNRGEPVPDGCYEVHMIHTDGISGTQEVFLQVTVDRPIARVQVRIHDALSNPVRALYLYQDDAGGADPTSGAMASSGSFQPSYCVSGPTHQVVVTSPGGLNVVWDGRNDAGTIVPGGNYNIELCWSDESTVSGTSIPVSAAPLAETSAAATVFASSDPNPVGSTVYILSNDCGGSSALTLGLRLYDSGNNLVQNVMGSAGVGQVVFNSTGLLAGTYQAQVDVYDPLGFTGTETLSLTFY